MDKTKRTLGSRRIISKRETKNVTSSASSNCDNEGTLDSQTISNQGKLYQNKPSGTCQPCTPKRQSSGKIKLESPALASPLQSTGYQTLIPKSFGSPEIEVSWDWGCSQVSKEMLPPRSKKKLKTQPTVPLSVPNGTYGPKLQESQISEEENQERLAFYKNILSRSLKHDDLTDSRENTSLENKADSHIISATNCMTPKRSTANETKGEDQINALFDDSANDLIFQCSQAVEEKIAKGEIVIENSLNVNIPNPKQPLRNNFSEHEHINKKVCYGKSKLSLFPEISKNEQPNCVETPRKNECHEKSAKQNNLSNCLQNLKPTKLIDSLDKKVDDVSTHTIHQREMVNAKLSSQKIKSNVSLNNNFEKPPSTHSHGSKYSMCDTDAVHTKQDKCPLPMSDITKLNINRLGNGDLNKNDNKFNIHFTVNNNELSSRIHTVVKSPDVKSLLEDEFDSELSSIDFDSLCHNSLRSWSHNPDTTAKESACSQEFKICSQQEIEKKRLAALNRLKMKKKGGFV